MNDTIASISTALGIGAISIIRVSGPECINIVSKIWKGKDLSKVDTHTIHYGHIIDKDNIIDEVLVSVMLAPKTYTKEDIIEINCHGGIATTNKVLELLLTNGARLAEPGEFTKRAFLNGRIDLVEADGIMNLINAKNEQTRNLSINQLSGKVSNMIKSLRDELIQMISNIEVNIDYPEYEDIEVLTNDKILPDILSFKNKPSIVVINKIDLDKNLTLPNIDKKIIEISVKDNIGIDTIKEEIKSIYNLEQIETTDMTYLSNARSISLLKQSLSKINESINNIKNESPIDMVELDLKNAWELLGEIIGETYTDELIDELFSRFCLGK